jgi:L-fuculose-phosphate aldolase
MADVSEIALREELVRQYQHVAAIGLNELASGNISCRFGTGLLISPTGSTAASLDPEQVVRVRANGAWEGEYRPSSEWRMHAEIYLRHPKAEAVVHTHSDYCVALSCLNQPLPGFHYLVGTFGGGDVPCVPYSTFGTASLARDAAVALTHRSACLLGNHGMICRGRSLADAVELAHRLEIMCRQYLLARQLGEPDVLTPRQWEEFFEQMRIGGYGH